MNDRAIGLLEQYDLEVRGTRKGRGAFFCDTDQGCLIFKEYAGNEQKIALQNRALEHIREQNAVNVERILPAKEGNLLVRDGDGAAYVLKTWTEGRECNIYDAEECAEAVRLLARLHCCMEGMDFAETVPYSDPVKEYEKHNRELRKVRRFLREKSQKSRFEICLQQAFDSFLEQAEEVTEKYRAFRSAKGSRSEYACLCHGDYQYHNIIKGKDGWHLINFEKIMRDNPVRDLYLLLRKLLEKSDWDMEFGRKLLSSYESLRPITDFSRRELYYRLAYPEKFWKIVNFYYNSGKAWIPERNLEKLNKLSDQEKKKKRFLEDLG